MKKRFLLFIVLLVSIFNISLVHATAINRKDIEVTEVEPIVNPLYENVLDVKDFKKNEVKYSAPLNAATDKSLNSAINALRKGMSKITPTITVEVDSSYGGTELYYTIWENAFNHTKVGNEGDYLKWGWSYRSGSYYGNYDSDGNYVYTFTYNVTYYETPEQEQKVTEELKKVRVLLNLTGSNYEKLNKIYDYIIRNVTYDWEHYNSDTSYPTQYTAYGALIDKTAVCQGYAVLLYRMALTEGIDSRIITNSNHAWNIVKLGNFYYNVDATWDAGSTVASKPTYYLRNMNNFSNHNRGSEYSTEEFNNTYPMSDYDYEDQPNKEESNLKYNSSTKRWEYYKNGKPDYTYTGYASNTNGTYYVQKGIVTFKYNRLVMYDGKWTAIVNSKVTPNYTGISTNSNGSYYLQNGVLSFNYNGNYKDSTGNVYILKYSKVDTNVNGLKYVNGTWYYFKKGKTDLTYTGVAANSNGIYYVNKGKITFKHNELIYYKNKWTAIVNSKVQPYYTGLSTNKNGTYMLINGTLNFNYSGYQVGSNGNIYILKNSKVDSTFTGLKCVGGVWLYFKRGVTDYTYTGLAKNANGTYYVQKGVITFKYNGRYVYNGRTYTIKYSKVVM